MSQGFSGKNFTKTSITVKEQDGSPNISKVTTIKVTNGKLTDDGNGEVSIDLSGVSSERVDKAEQNIILNTFRLQIQNSLSLQNMVDGFADEYEDETGIDAGASINESYDATDDFYEPTTSPISSDIVLLLHGDGNDGSTTIIDSSNAAHTMTANGDAQIDTDQSKFGGASILFDGAGDNVSTPASSDFQLTGSGGSVAFDGAGDYLTIPDSADWNFGSGDFTIDFWIKFNDVSTTMNFVGQRQAAGNFWVIQWDGAGGTGNLVFDAKSASSPVVNITRSFNISINRWYHLAVTRSSDIYRLFADGVQLGSSVTDSDAIPDFSGLLEIGIIDGGGSNQGPLNGEMDEIRVSKGVARFTANFTPATSEYTSDANTQLLLHLTSNFTDSGNTGHTVTAVGDAAIDNENFVALNGTDFTIDCWVRLTDFADDMTIVALQSDASNRWQFRISTGGNFVFQIQINALFSVNLQPAAGIAALGAFKHVAVSRSGHDWRFFLDGTQVGSTFFNATGFPAFSASTEFQVGIRGGASDPMKGHVDELRITKGVALYTANFTPDTSETGPTLDNMILIANGQTAVVQPSTARVVILEEDIDSIILNTDLTCFASRDGGTTFTQITLINEGTFGSSKNILAASVDISAQPAGTSMVYKITTLNNKALKIHATGLLWD